MQTSPLLESLMEALRCLPGVGPKSAQRMAFHLLQRDRSGGMQLAQALTRAMSEIGHCQGCRTFTEKDHCSICTNPRRQQSGQICVVESPADIYAIEQTGQFVGRYFHFSQFFAEQRFTDCVVSFPSFLPFIIFLHGREYVFHAHKQFFFATQAFFVQLQEFFVIGFACPSVTFQECRYAFAFAGRIGGLLCLECAC